MNPKSVIRFRVGVALLATAGVAALCGVALLSRGSIVGSTALLLSVVLLVGLLGAMYCLVVPTGVVRTSVVVAWSAPGLVAILASGLGPLSHLYPFPFAFSDVAVGMLFLLPGIVSPFTSIAVTTLAARSRARTHAVLCAGSWVGVLLFWNRALMSMRLGA